MKLLFINEGIFELQKSPGFLREFQPMASAPDDRYLLSDQDTNCFFVLAGIES